MSKRKRRKKEKRRAKPRKQTPKRSSGSQHSRSQITESVARDIGFSLWILAAYILTYIFYIADRIDRLSDAVQNSFHLLLGAVILVRLSLYIPIYKNLDSRNLKDIMYVERLYLLRDLLAVVALTVITFVPIYVSGFPNKLARFIATQFPRLKAQLVDVISKLTTLFLSAMSGYLESIILGALGNLLYDIVKKLLRRRTRRKARNSKRT